jgi:hypothetical protein
MKLCVQTHFHQEEEEKGEALSSFLLKKSVRRIGEENEVHGV